MNLKAFQTWALFALFVTPILVSCDSGGSSSMGEEPALRDTSTVLGAVTSTSGDPVEGAEVTILRASGSEGQLASGVTGTDGTYELTFSVARNDAPKLIKVQVSTDDLPTSEKEVSFDEVITADFILSPFNGGDGTTGNPFKVATAQQLQKIDEFPGDDFVQTQDIDASTTTSWNGGRGFLPIGKGRSFTGSFDGNSYEIVGLTIDVSTLGSTVDTLGVFGVVEEGTVKDVVLRDMQMTGGGSTVGMLVGDNQGGRVEGVFVEGTLTGADQAGGLVGLNTGSVRSSEASVDLINVGGNSGGLVGANGESLGQRTGLISNSVSTGDVTGVEGLGGLVGENTEESTIRSSQATGNVQATGSGDDDSRISAGGLVSNNSGTIRGSMSTGNVTANPQKQGEVGGLVSSNSGTIRRSQASGNVKGSGNPVGGLVGNNSAGRIENSKATGTVEVTVGSGNSSDGKAGGLVGSMRDGFESFAVVFTSYATGSVTTNSSDHVAGGLIGKVTGDNSAAVSESFAVGLVSGKADQTGGLIGAVEAGFNNRSPTISRTYWDRETTNQDSAIGNDSSSGTTGLTTNEMQGESAEQNLGELDFQDTWQTVTGDYPALLWENI